ncbi:MAG TPA: hypothetical protein VFZ79_19010, partial [Acidimicrobiales bacterium]
MPIGVTGRTHAFDADGVRRRASFARHCPQLAERWRRSMNTQPKPSEIVIMASGAVAFIFSFFDWFG